MGLPTVTQVLKPWMDFSMVSEEVLNAASERGDVVHEICATIARKCWVMDVPDEYLGYINSFNRWLRVAVAEIILVEQRLYDHDLGFCGKPDLICRLRGDEVLTLVDYKTGKIVQKTWGPQTAAYRHLGRKNGHNIERIMSLRLSADGKPPIITETTRNMNALFNVFLCALQCHKYFEG